MKFALTRIIKFSVLLTVSVSLASCSEDFDIQKAQELGSHAQPFEEQYEEIVKDIYQSCKRNARYRGAVIRQAGKATRQALESKCLGVAYNQKALLMAHQTLAKYTGAFRKLSSDELIEELDGAGNLADALIALPVPGLSEAQPILSTLPIAELANAIQRAIAERKRRKVLKKTVSEVNTNIQLYISELSRITEEQYYTSLRIEELGMNRYFASIVSQELDKKNTDIPVQVSVLQVDKLWQTEMEKINFPERYNRIHNYVITLKKMANSHQDLYRSVKGFDE